MAYPKDNKCWPGRTHHFVPVFPLAPIEPRWPEQLPQIGIDYGNPRQHRCDHCHMTAQITVRIPSPKWWQARLVLKQHRPTRATHPRRKRKP